MSTSAAVASSSAVPVSANASPPRASRPANPRPTTYTGVSPSVTSAATPASPNLGGPPIPPPRTSSQRQSASAGERSSRNRNVDGGHDRERGERDRERERADKDRRRAEEDKRRRENPQPVGRSNSTTESSRNASASHGTERSGSTRRRQDDASTSRAGASAARSGTRKETRFGEYILGQTLGEGEFGKVKLGWRRDGGAQVAIKLIRRDTVSNQPNRLSKIYREISILRTLSHPNIVRLHEMVETDRHIGIILEYASGGELFDYILTHRYLKDPPACRLFAQLVSGVGYLHKKGIVHRDLKLENLLLDRNRNIIITDFGFANVFDPADELGELEAQLENPQVLKELEKGVPKDPDRKDTSLLKILGPGHIRRRGDLMATSCGSPCYAAPELVVSDGLYTGRKVDVWSCGVILYAMLAGYLPFDDDPANPEGDNINLLYKYITTTPLTFPEYVTPHARDLLRRILVPEPRKRADLFEVARHSWLAPFADVVNKITSATTGIKEVETVAIKPPKTDAPLLTRSASVREPTSHTQSTVAAGGHGPRHHPEQVHHTSQKPSAADAKRRTVQVEYVEPSTQTKRGSAVDPDEEENATAPPPPPVARSGKEGVNRAATTAGTTRPVTQFVERDSPSNEDPGRMSSRDKGKTRPVSYHYASSSSRATAPGTDGAPSGPPSRRPSKDSRNGQASSTRTGDTGTRPTTANSLGSTRLPSRGSYSQPAAPSVAANNAQGRITMPKSGKPYTISKPIPQPETEQAIDRLGVVDPRPVTQPDHHGKGHKRANTVGGGNDTSRFLGKFMGSDKEKPEPALHPVTTRADKRQSLDQGAGRYEKPSNKGRRFSLLPTNFSLRSMGDSRHERRGSRASRSYNQPPTPQIASQPQLTVLNNTDGASALTASDASLTAGSAPASACDYGRESVDRGDSRKQRTTLQKHKKLGEAYEGEITSGGHGSSGPARRVMDFFRRRGVVRSKGA